MNSEAKRRVWERDNYICHYCRRHCGDQPTVDHFVPRALGGGDGMDNLVTCCAPCNAEKADTLPESFKARKKPNAGKKHKKRRNPADREIRRRAAERKMAARWAL